MGLRINVEDLNQIILEILCQLMAVDKENEDGEDVYRKRTSPILAKLKEEKMEALMSGHPEKVKVV